MLNYIVVDLEVAGDQPGDALDLWGSTTTVTLAAHAHADGRVKAVHLDHPDSVLRSGWRERLTTYAKLLQKYDLLVGHNISYDLCAIYAATGVDLTQHCDVWDTMVGAHLLRPNDRASAGLKQVVPIVFKDASDWAAEADIDFRRQTAREYPLDVLERYALQDVYWTRKLFLWQLEHLFVACDFEPVTREEHERAALGWLATELAMKTVKSTARLTMQGMPVDPPTVEKFTEVVQRSYDRNMEQYAQAYDIELYEGPKKSPRRVQPSVHATSKYFKAWMDCAVEAGEAEVLARTRTGAAQWDRHSLAKLVRRGSESLVPVLNARKSSKRLEYLGAISKWTHDGVVHSKYRPGTLTTGRLACSDPNLQQIEAALKPVFKAPDGFVFIDCDYSQIELRMAAHIARVDNMLEAYAQGIDLHSDFASKIAHVDITEVTKAQRQAAKSANFGLLFRQQATGFRDFAEKSYGIDMSLDEATALRDKWFEVYPEVNSWHGDVIQELYDTQQVKSLTGRIRRFPRPWGENESAAINFSVQSLAGDLMQLALYDLTERGPGQGITPVTAVHDAVVCLVPVDRWEECAKIIEETMTVTAPQLLEGLMGHSLRVPIEVEYTAGTRWGWNDVSG